MSRRRRLLAIQFPRDSVCLFCLCSFSSRGEPSSSRSCGYGSRWEFLSSSPWSQDIMPPGFTQDFFPDLPRLLTSQVCLPLPSCIQRPDGRADPARMMWYGFCTPRSWSRRVCIAFLCSKSNPYRKKSITLVPTELNPHYEERLTTLDRVLFSYPAQLSLPIHDQSFPPPLCRSSLRSQPSRRRTRRNPPCPRLRRRSSGRSRSRSRSRTIRRWSGPRTHWVFFFLFVPL